MAGSKVRLKCCGNYMAHCFLCRGVSYIDKSKVREELREGFVTEKAPRTAAVVHKNGTLSLMQVRAVVLLTTLLSLLSNLYFVHVG